MAETISVDYLVIGAGAMGMAFVDTLIVGNEKTVAIVDRYDRPGGHWLAAYPFVRLHQPAASYGVNSTRLERDRIEEVGWNKGLADCSSRDDVLSYFERVMREKLLPSGRVRYFHKHDYNGKGLFRSIITGKSYRVGEGTCIVDATYSRVEVPSMRPPPYNVAPEVDIVTPNSLAGISKPYSNYTVVGAGKTGMDACLWMLENGIDANQITWVRPRDALCFNRAAFQPLVESVMAFNMNLIGAIMSTETVDEMLEYLKKQKFFLVIDEGVTPRQFHCATLSEVEVEALKRISKVVRKGRVTSITPGEVILEQGSYKPDADTLYVDCSASAIPKISPVPVFQENSIVLQPVRWCQQTFSAALVAHVEATYGEDRKLKNELCGPIPMPDRPVDFLRVSLENNRNALGWFQNPQTAEWLKGCRLDMLRRATPEDPEERTAFVQQMIAGLGAASQKIQVLIDKLPEKDAAKMRAELQGFTVESARL